MRTVTQLTRQGVRNDLADNTAALTAAGWENGNDPERVPLHFESDTLIQSTWQHNDHEHAIVIRYAAHLDDPKLWDRTITLVWVHANGKKTDFRLPTDVPLEAAAETFDGQPITLATIIAMCRIIDLREVA